MKSLHKFRHWLDTVLSWVCTLLTLLLNSLISTSIKVTPISFSAICLASSTWSSQQEMLDANPDIQDLYDHIQAINAEYEEGSAQ